MNERLAEDWLTKANERSYQTPFAQYLLAQGMQVLRVAHSPHEHGKDIIAIGSDKKIHAYQLKDGDLDLKQLEKGIGQINALVETQVEHSAIQGHPRHQPWLVISGQITIPADDRIRVYNASWKKRKFTPLKVIVGQQLLVAFSKMAENFWPQSPTDSHRLFNLYLADGKGALDRDAFANLIDTISFIEKNSRKPDVARKLSAANLFASYALSPFYRSQNHWELVQGWTITASHIAWVAEESGLHKDVWQSTFRLAVDSAMLSLQSLVDEAIKPNALRPSMFSELDELTRSRCTICAGVIAARTLISFRHNDGWQDLPLVGELLEKLFTEGRLIVWGESAIPHFLAIVWALDQLRGDQFSDRILFAALSAVVNQNHGYLSPKLPSAYGSADDANARIFRRLFKGEKAMELQASTSSTLESLVTVVTRRMWRNALSIFWSPITKIDLERIVPDKPRDVLLWRWGYKYGSNQTRRYSPTQSWRELLSESRRNENNAIPHVLRDEFDFALLFFLCFPHRLSPPMIKYFEEKTSFSVS